MASRAFLVHLGGSHFPALGRVPHQTHHLPFTAHIHLLQALDIHLAILILLEFQVDPIPEHIDQLLLVELHHRTLDLHVRVFLLLQFQDFLEASMDQPVIFLVFLAEDGEGLA